MGVRHWWAAVSAAACSSAPRRRGSSTSGSCGTCSTSRAGASGRGGNVLGAPCAPLACLHICVTVHGPVHSAHKHRRGGAWQLRIAPVPRLPSLQRNLLPRHDRPGCEDAGPCAGRHLWQVGPKQSEGLQGYGRVQVRLGRCHLATALGGQIRKHRRRGGPAACCAGCVGQTALPSVGLAFLQAFLQSRRSCSSITSRLSPCAKPPQCHGHCGHPAGHAQGERPPAAAARQHSPLVGAAHAHATLACSPAPSLTHCHAAFLPAWPPPHASRRSTSTAS